MQGTTRRSTHKQRDNRRKAQLVTRFEVPAEPPDAHPAKWSPEILAVVAPIIRDQQLPVHDPCAERELPIARSYAASRRLSTVP